MNRVSWSIGIGMLAACLVIAGCPSSSPVPEVEGMTQAAATAVLTGAGLTVGAITQEYSDSVPVGQVVSQNPAAGLTVVPGTAVDLVLSAAAETVMLPGEVPLEMEWIPGGTFTMGSPDTEPYRGASEGPQHQVTLDGFWMGRYQVTKRQWTAVKGTSPWLGQKHEIDDPESPAVYVSWNDTQDFIAAVNVLTDQAYRLPSEAEWEYACRAGTTTQYFWGNDPTYTDIADYAWYAANCLTEQYAHLVGQKLPNAWGLYDMSGNAYEWCQDWVHETYAGAPTDGSAWVLPVGTNRMVRGGAWGIIPTECRSASRASSEPGNASYGIGLRVVRTP